MRALLAIAFILINATAIAQTCDTIQGRILNCLDSVGNKQGDWEEWTWEWRQKEDYGPVPGFCQTAPFVKARARLISKGKYIDNERVGKWDYYNYQGKIWSTVFYTPDSLMLHSIVETPYKDKVHVLCEDSLCAAWFNDIELTRFSLHNMDFEHHRIAIGVYQREIEKGKN